MSSSVLLPAVSVVVPHFGEPAPTVSLIDSLKSQTGIEPLQIIVVDDASLVSFPDYLGVTVIRRPHNGGFGSAVNSGVAVSQNQLTLILNSDLEIGPTLVADLVQAAAPFQPVIASPQVIGHDGAPQWVGRHFPTIKHQTVEWLTPLARWRHLKSLHEAVGHDTRCVSGQSVAVDWVMGAAMLVPTKKFLAVGGFDESYFMNAEEIDLQRRLREQGVPARFVGSVGVVHEGGGSSDSQRRRQWLVSSRDLYARKWGHPRALRLALTLASGANFVVNSLRQLRDRRVDASAVLRQEVGYLKRAKS